MSTTHWLSRVLKRTAASRSRGKQQSRSESRESTTTGFVLRCGDDVAWIVALREPRVGRPRTQRHVRRKDSPPRMRRARTPDCLHVGPRWECRAAATFGPTSETARKVLSSVIAIITDAFLSSAFCMNEVGAAWVLGKDFYPIAGPSLPYSKLDGVLPGLQVNRMDTPGVLDDLAERVENALGIPRNSADWGCTQRSFKSV